MRSSYISALRYTLLSVWVVFTVSLAGWWYIFGVQQTSRIMALEHQPSPQMARHFRMLAWEGGTFFVCLLAGGVALAYFMIQEVRQKRRLQIFFSTFTHELKTPLASLRLQAESLKEDLSESPQSKLVDRLVSDTQRLSIQLENSLFLANESSARLLLEKINLRTVIDALAHYWPTLTITVENDCIVEADARALECILTNILQNAVVHGKAKTVTFSATASGKDLVRVRIRDDGSGFHQDNRQLGKLFGRVYSGSGNGIGLYLVRRLMQRMGGDVEFIPNKHFELALIFKGDTA
ncbi:MAG: HAMP domain-containing histidine kinase [Deltaproteobacteria bacterium]|nr:HAMP domain-containing histidine kinase [Deltaproteobacteria bacterium]